MLQRHLPTLVSSRLPRATFIKTIGTEEELLSTMAPDIAQNSETIVNELTIVNGDVSIVNGNGSVKESVGTVTVCPAELPCRKVKPVRKVTRPKILRNLESHHYLYDRLYDTTCPRTVSGFD